MKQYDIVIIGGGLCGLTLLRALSGSGLRILLIDQGNKYNSSATDMRPLVLSQTSKQLFEALGQWQDISSAVRPLQAVKISASKHLGCLKLDAKEQGFKEFGYIVQAGFLYETLLPGGLGPTVDYWPDCKLISLKKSELGHLLTIQSMKEPIEHIVDTCCMIAADGADSTVSRLLKVRATPGDITQAIVIPNLKVKAEVAPHLRFIGAGSIAWLPTGEQLGSMVMTCSSEYANYLEKNPQKVCKILQQQWRRHLFLEPQDIHRLITYPVGSFILPKLAMPGVFWVGNAAHALPPVGAQGFNLGCRDVATLAALFHENLVAADTLPLNHDDLAERYHSRRWVDCHRTYRLTTQSLKKFQQWSPFMNVGRSLGLVSFDGLPQARNMIAALGVGAGDHWLQKSLETLKESRAIVSQ